MAEFLTTKGVSYNIEKIIIEAKSELVLISPFLKLSRTFYERLKEASGKGVSIVIIYGINDLKPNEQNSLSEISTVQLYYFENLHAKCYFNETRMVITSMNMYEFSEHHNREMGVLIERNKDKALYESALKEASSILQISDYIPLQRPDRSISYNIKNSISNSLSRGSKKVIRGYCIRCEERIEYNPSRPYCPDCFTVWVQYENYDYRENVCHNCGEYEPSTMARPQCFDCFTRSGN